MDDLLKIAASVLTNFDPATNNADDFEPIPDGEYACLIENVSSKTNDNGTPLISIKCSIIDGDHTGSLIFINYYFGKLVERTIKQLSELFFAIQDEKLTAENFQNLETITDKISEINGSTVLVTKTTQKNGFAKYKISSY